MKYIRVFAASVVFFLCWPVWGNDASYFGHGSSVFAYKEQRIRMVSEHIRIKEDQVDGYPNTEWLADCEFVFENLNDEPVEIQMGFPDQGSFPNRNWSIRAFETRIKGQTIPVAHKVVDPNHGRRRMRRGRVPRKNQPPLLPDDYDPDGWRAMAKKAMTEMNLRFGAAYTWTVKFAPRERIVVKNRYRFGGGNSNGPVTTCLEFSELPKVGGFWYDEESGTGFGDGPCLGVPYVVSTGRTWHGPIEDAIIEIEIPARYPPNHVIPVPAATTVTANTVRWHFKNFEPDQELYLVLATSWTYGEEDNWGRVDFSSVKQVKRWLKFGETNGFSKAFIQRMRDVQAYSFGLRPAGAAAPAVFNEWTRPLVKDAVSVERLNPAHAKILKTFDDAISATPRAVIKRRNGQPSKP